MPTPRTDAWKRRALGQHYLIDRSIISKMIELARIKQGDRVMEIGTGKGVVTRELCKISSKVEAFELDGENYLITERLGLAGLSLRREDAFALPRDFDVLVSSLPYSESSNFVEWLAGLSYQRAVVLLQKDFAEKLLATPGDETYRAVSVLSQISCNLEIVEYVDRGSFQPSPKVTSVLAVMIPRQLISTEQIHLIRMLFSQRRKKLESALRSLQMELSRGNPCLLSRRVERLNPQEIAEMLPRIRVV